MTNKEKDILEWEFEELLRNIVQGYLKLCDFKMFETWLDTHKPIKEIYDITIKSRNYMNSQSFKWIRVEDRLPEDRRVVLVTAYWHETYQVMEACYFGDGEWWCVPYNNCGDHMQRLKPKAWMELPEAYKPEEVITSHYDS